MKCAATQHSHLSIAMPMEMKCLVFRVRAASVSSQARHVAPLDPKKPTAATPPHIKQAGTTCISHSYSFCYPRSFFLPHFFEDIGRRHPEKLEGFKFDNAPPWLRSKILAHIWNQGIWVGVTAFIVVPIFMKQSIQEQLTVSSRNILQSAEAFLVPYKEIFQFVEDIVSIKINYALSSRD